MRGHIRRRGVDSWQIAIYRGTDPHGKKLYNYVTVHGTRRQAEQKLTELVRSLDTGEYVEPSRETVGQYLRKWLDMKRQKVRPRTIEFYELRIRHLDKLIGSIPLQRLSPLHIEQAYSRLIRKVSPAMAAGAHRTLRAALNQAVKWRLINVNPVTAVDPPRAPRPVVTPLTLEQVGEFLKAAAKTPLYSLYLTSILTGLRRGELLALQWDDIDLEGKTITVRRTLTRGGSNPIFSPTKTRSGHRVVEISDALVSVLKDHRRQQKEHRLALGPIWQENNLIWPNERGQAMTPSVLHRHFKKLLEAAKLPKSTRFHDLRHTHASLLLASGTTSLKLIQERLGHSSITITADTYSHLLPGAQREAVDKLEKTLLGKGASSR